MKIIALTLIKNEENRFLLNWLENCNGLFDQHIFLDNGSSDNTLNIINDFSSKMNYKVNITSNTASFSKNEYFLRNQLWEACRKLASPDDWIFLLDSDEFIDKKEFLKFKNSYFQNVDQSIDAFKFNLLDIWTMDGAKYRYDKFWSPSNFLSLIRFKNLPFTKNANLKGLHHPRLPSYIDLKRCIHTHIQISHFAYANEAERLRKYEFYTSKKTLMSKDDYSHVLSIIDNEIKLKDVFNSFENKKIVIASLIHDREEILKHFLYSLQNVYFPDGHIEFYFIANNCKMTTIDILKDFSKWCKNKQINCVIKEINFELENLGNHEFNETLLAMLSDMRDDLLEYSKKNNFDYLFSIDSDILVPPFLLRHLIAKQVPIISPVFYSCWNVKPKKPEPQVKDFSFFSSKYASIQNINNSKTFKVGYLGAITLFDISQMPAELNYQKWPNAVFKGEDWFFCTKASILGIDMFADFAFSIIHIDDEKDFDFYLKHNILQYSDNTLQFYDYDLKRNNPFYYKNSLIYCSFRIWRARLKSVIIYFFVVPVLKLWAFSKILVKKFKKN